MYTNLRKLHTACAKLLIVVLFSGLFLNNGLPRLSYQDGQLTYESSVHQAEAAYYTPSIKSVGTEASGSTDITTNLPTYADGDFMLLYVFWNRGDFTIPTIPGWTLVRHAESSNNQFYTGLTVYSMTATSSVTAPVVPLDISGTVRTIIVSFNNAVGVDVSGANTSGAGGLTTFDAPSVTTTQHNTLILNAMVHRQAENVTPPNTSLYVSSSGSPRAALSNFTQADPGSTGTQAFTATSMHRPTAITVAVYGKEPTPGTFSGTLYSDHGDTPITGTSYTVKAAVGTSSVGVFSTTTNSSDGTFSFDLPTTTSPTTWTKASSSDQYSWSAIAFGNGRFVAVAPQLSNEVMYSTDGAAWTTVDTGFDVSPEDIVFANGRFDAVGGGTDRHIYTYDGITWYQGGLTSDRLFIEYGEEDGIYVAMHVDGRYNYSYDGDTWTYGGDATGVNVTDLTYGEGKFRASVEAGTNASNRMIGSIDGVTWGSASFPSVTGNDSVTYGNDTFVAVTEDGVTNKIYYSADGGSFTAATAPGGGDLNYDVVRYVNGYFVAIANEATTTTESIGLSTDGITWEEAVLPELNTWQDIAYGNGRIVAVSSDGNSRVMYAETGIGPETPITVWVDGAAVKATSFMMGANNDRGVDDIPLYQDTFTTRNATFNDNVSITELERSAFYDSSDDADILYTTTVGTGSTTVGSAVDFYVASGTTRLAKALVADGDFANFGSLLSASSTIYMTGTGVSATGTLTGADALNVLSVSGSVTMQENASTTSLVIESGGTLTAPAELSITGDYTNSGTFTHNSGTVYFDGTSQQTATGTMTGTSQFYDLILNNTSGSGAADQSLIIGNDLTATGTFTMLPGASTAFKANATSSFNNIVWSGTSTTTNPVYAYSTVSGTQWYIQVDGTATVDDAWIKDSHACASTGGGLTATTSVDAGNNTCWTFPAGSSVVQNWNGTAWTLYDTITIDATTIDDNLTDFPVYVDLSDLSATFWSTTPSAASYVGTDIRVTTDGGSPVELPRELVFASSTAQTGELWFKADSIASTTDTVFRIYYNGTTTGDYATSSTYGAQNVWTNGFEAVYHLNEDPGVAGAGEIIDSTGNGNDGTDNGSMTTADKVAGKTGYAFDFDGTNDYVALTDIDYTSAPLTISGWGNTNSAATMRLISKSVHPTQTPSILVTSGTIEYAVDNYASNDSYAASANDSSWHYYTLKADSSDMYGYYDGVEVASSTHDNSWVTSNDVFTIGSHNTGASEFWNGQIDEVRIASSTRSDAWIKAEYYNQATSTDFYTVNQTIGNPNFLTLSGTLFSDEGVSGITSGKTIKLAVGTSTVSVHSTTTDSGLASFHFDIGTTSLIASGTPVTLWVDGDSSTIGSVSTVLSSTTANISGLDIYQHHVIIRHEGSGQYSSTTVTAAMMSFYDSSDDGDIPFTAVDGAPTSTVFTVTPGNELYVWTNDNFSPGGSVVINGGAANAEDGSFQLAAGAGYFGVSGSLTVAGNFAMDATSHFFPHASGTVFTATSTGHTISAPINNTSRHYDSGAFTFNGSGGGWTISGNATTSDFDIQAGTVTNTTGTLVVTGHFSNAGTFTHNDGTLQVGPGVGFNMDEASFSQNVNLAADLNGSGQCLWFSPGGTKFFICDNTAPSVRGYTLSTPWDLTSRSLDGVLNTSSQAGNSWTVAITPDGKTLYHVNVTDPIYVYEMSTAWDITSASYTGRNVDLPNTTGMRVMKFSPDGTLFYAGGTAVQTYELARPWDISLDSATYLHSYNFIAQEDQVHGLEFNEDGTELYVTGRGGDDVNVYSLSVPYYIASSSISYVNTPFSLQTAEPRGSFISSDGTKYFVTPNSSELVSVYDLKQKPQTLSGTLTGTSPLGDVVIENTSTTTFSSNASTTDLTINGTTTAPSLLSVSGNYTNNSVFDANSGEVVLNGSAQQTLSGTMVGSSAFYDLTLNNSSQNGVTNQSVVFGAAASTTNTMTMLADTSAAFTAGAGYTFQNVDWDGASASTPIYLRSTSAGSQWQLDIPGSQLNVEYVNVKDSDATQTSGGVTAGHSIDGGNNTNWTFGGVTAWNATAWTLYNTITIDATNVDDDLTDFPVYVDLSDLSATFWSTTPSATNYTGTDIRVTTDDGSPVELSRELVFASSTAQTGELHFKANSISSTTDTVFRIYYNGTTTGDYATNATYGAENVWTNDYRAVWHFQENLTGAYDEVLDSTANGYHGSSSAMDSSDVVAGKLGGNSYSFGNATNELIDMGDPADGGLDFGANQTFTISFWGNSTDPAADEYALSKRNATGYQFIHSDPNGTFNWRIDEGGLNVDNPIADTSVLDGSWRYIVGGRSTTESFLYNNLSSTTVSDTSLADLSETEPLLVGAGTTGGGATWNGEIDEVRVASTSRSAAWIKAEYYNQSTTTDFYTVNLVVVTGSSTIADHDATQVNNAFDFRNKTNEALFAFKLTPESGTATVTNAVVTISGANKMNASDFSNIRLYRDLDADAAYDASDTQVGGAGVMSINDQAGTITFTGDFLSTTTQNYVIIADWNAPANGSHFRLSLPTTGLTMVDGNGSVEVFGSVTSVQHNRNNKGGGGGAVAAVGGAPPAGDGDVGGGGAGGGGAIDTNTGGDTIGNEVDYNWPSANSGNWSTAANAYDDTDGTYATETTNSEQHQFTNYSHGVPGTDTIQGVAVKLEISGTTAAGDISVELSWDGGTSWTTAKTTPTLTTSDTVVTLGGASDTWGRGVGVWQPSHFSDANFALRITGNVSSNEIRVDGIQVKVFHQAGGGGSGGGGGGGAI